MNEKETKKSAQSNGSAAVPCYKRVAWTRSMSEELIGTLWCVVAVLAYGFDVKWLMYVAGLKAVIGQIISIYFSVKEIKSPNGK